jgi:hypothetical protein
MCSVGSPWAGSADGAKYATPVFIRLRDSVGARPFY